MIPCKFIKYPFPFASLHFKLKAWISVKDDWEAGEVIAIGMECTDFVMVECE